MPNGYGVSRGGKPLPSAQRVRGHDAAAPGDGGDGAGAAARRAAVQRLAARRTGVRVEDSRRRRSGGQRTTSDRLSASPRSPAASSLLVLRAGFRGVALILSASVVRAHGRSAFAPMPLGRPAPSVGRGTDEGGAMAVRVAINGLGRTGRAAFRAAHERGLDIEWVGLNDLDGRRRRSSHLLRHDSVYGPFPGTRRARRRRARRRRRRDPRVRGGRSRRRCRGRSSASTSSSSRPASSASAPTR